MAYSMILRIIRFVMTIWSPVEEREPSLLLTHDSWYRSLPQRNGPMPSDGQIPIEMYPSFPVARQRYSTSFTTMRRLPFELRIPITPRFRSRGLASSLVDRLVHPHHIGRIEHGCPKVVGFEGRILIEQFLVIHARSQLLENELNSQTRAFERGLSCHDVLSLFNVILPLDFHGLTPPLPRSVLEITPADHPKLRAANNRQPVGSIQSRVKNTGSSWSKSLSAVSRRAPVTEAVAAIQTSFFSSG